jgi:putative nucleotidyltransferase with HDIG domain
MLREQAFEELKSRINNVNMIRHSLAVEAIMRAFGRYFKDDEEKWAITGLLHDIDYEKTKDDPSKHGLFAEEILGDLGVEDFIIYAIKSHNDATGLERKRRLDKILFSADPLSGLIVACALISPDKKLEDVTEDFVMKRMDEKSFAQGANRDKIKTVTEAGIELHEFIKISLAAMKKIAAEIGL